MGDQDLVEHGLFPNPVGLTFVEEGGDAFAGFRRGAQVGDAVGGVFDQGVGQIAGSAAGRSQLLASSICRPSRDASWKACIRSSTW